MTKREAIGELISQMSWYAFKEGESNKGVAKIARESYRDISTTHSDLDLDDILNFWGKTGQWNLATRLK